MDGLDWTGGFDAWAVFASLAKKNFPELSVFDCPITREGVLSDIEGLNETMGRFGTSLSAPPSPSPDACVGGSYTRSGSLASVGVPVGVPEGVVFVLSTRDLRDPDLGVTLMLRKVETGVERSSLDAAAWELSVHLADGVVGAAPATLGVNGLLLGCLAAPGIRGRGAFCLS